MEEKSVTTTLLPINEDRSAKWDSSAAEKRVRDWAGASDAPNAKYRRAFLWYDSESPELFGSYKLQVGDIIDGKLVAIFRAVAAVKGVLAGARGGVNIPEADKAKVSNIVSAYYKKWGVEETYKSENEKISFTAGFTVDPITKELGHGEVQVLVSNSGIDRHGESISVDGIDLSQVKRNPVVLWAHDYSGLPIGKITKIFKSAGNLIANIQLATDTYDFANLVYKMILNGFVNAVSIGGIVRKWAEDMTTIEKLEMVEVSFVPVGAHPDALVLAKSLEVTPELIREQFDDFVYRSILDKRGEFSKDEIGLQIKALKNLTSALETAYRNSKEPEEKISRKKLVVFKSYAKQIDKAAENIISQIKSEF